jgi:hypothetical protein
MFKIVGGLMESIVCLAAAVSSSSTCPGGPADDVAEGSVQPGVALGLSSGGGRMGAGNRRLTEGH